MDFPTQMDINSGGRGGGRGGQRELEREREREREREQESRLKESGECYKKKCV